MINWEELKHIHVIRKFETILAQWFSTDIFFVDDRGAIRNYDPLNSQRTFENPLCGLLLSCDLGRNKLSEFFKKANEKLFQSGQQRIVIDGPVGVEKILISRISMENEYLGSVFAYSFFELRLTDEIKSKVKKFFGELGINGEVIDQALSQLRNLSDAEQKYFYELIDLVAQEIVTYTSEITSREQRISELNGELGRRHRYDAMIGKSKPMQYLYTLLDKVKNSEATVLIQGENGTGKELIAKAIHYNSPRKDKQFITVNCSAFNENLLESELFGHVKGAFTGAIKDKKGLFEAADCGTLFLDEIGDMSAAMQVKLLRVFQEGTFTPVGGTNTVKIDVRILAATNRDLNDMVDKGTFREDLYYRINVINIVVPPLRERKEDIPVLVDHFLRRGCEDKSLPQKAFAKSAMEKVYDYNWPGNIRQLENEVERLIVLSGQETRITRELLSPKIRDFGESGKVQGVRVAGKLKDALEELEKAMIREGLKRTNFNKSRLAKELGISRAGLIMKVEKYGLDKRRFVSKEKDGRGVA